jgi:predicted transcriptional regulator
MELRLTPEKEALLQQLATRTGRPTSDLLEEAIDRFLDYDAWFIREVEKGLAQADHGELIDHEEVVARIEKHIQTRRSRF